MTISNTTNKTSLALGNGVTVNFTFSFKILAAANLKVWLVDNTTGVAVLKALSTDYTVTINTQTEGGTVTFLTAPPTGQSVLVKRVLGFTQDEDLPTESNFPEESVENGIDYVTMLAIQLKEELDRTLKFSETSEFSGATIEDPIDGQTLIWNEATNSYINALPADLDLVAVSSFWQTILILANAAQSRAALDVQQLNTNLTALSALTGAANKLAFFTSLTTMGLVDLFSNKNAIINGDFNIWQRGTSFAAAADNSYSTDRWFYGKDTTAVHTISRSTDVPTVAQAGRLFNYSLLLDCTTANASIGATDRCIIGQRIEGFNWLPLAQKEITLSFWVKATKTGIYCISLQNAASDRTIAKEYTINATNTWEYKTLTFPASPSAGTWDYTTGVGIQVIFTLANGSTNRGAADTWSSSNITSTANQVNGVDSTSNDFRLCGVQLEAGSVATPFEMKKFGESLRECMRYFQKSFSYAVTPATNIGRAGAHEFFQTRTTGANSVSTSIRLPVVMRTSPTVVLYNPEADNHQVRNLDADLDWSSSVPDSMSEGKLGVNGTLPTTDITQLMSFQYTLDAEL